MKKSFNELLTLQKIEEWSLRMAGTFYIFSHTSGLSVVISHYISDRFVVVLSASSDPIFLGFFDRIKVKRFLNKVEKQSPRTQIKREEIDKYKKELGFIASRPVFIDV